MTSPAQTTKSLAAPSTGSIAPDDATAEELLPAGPYAPRPPQDTVAIGEQSLFLHHSLVKLPADTSDYKLLQQWQGRVDEVGSETFTATLYDQTTPSNPPEIGEFPLEEVSIEERRLLFPGAVFYWSIGYENYRRGQRKRTSTFRFRRLAPERVTEAELHQRMAQIDRFFDEIFD